MAGTLTRRGFLRLGAGMAGAAGLSSVLAACSGETQEQGLVMLSTRTPAPASTSGQWTHGRA